jgi:hypothetical protein
MNYSLEIKDTHVPAITSAFFELFPHKLWIDRERQLRQELKANPFLLSYLGEMHGRELILGRIADLHRRGEFPPIPNDARVITGIGLMKMCVAVHQSMDNAGKKKVLGMVKDGLNRSLEYVVTEFETIFQLAGTGYKTELHDMSSSTGGYDILAEKDGLHIEVECKTITSDKGRQFRERDFAALSKLLFDPFKKHRASSNEYLIGFATKSRLPTSHKELAAIAAYILRCVDAGVGVYENETCKVNVSVLTDTQELISDTEIDKTALRARIATLTGDPNAHITAHYHRKTEKLSVLYGGGINPDDILEALFDTLHESAEKQMSKTLPGAFIARFTGIDNSEVAELVQSGPSGEITMFQAKLAEFFKDERHKHVHQIACRGRDGVVEYQGSSRIGALVNSSYREVGTVATFTNRAHPLADDPRMKLFRRVE